MVVDTTVAEVLSVVRQAIAMLGGGLAVAVGVGALYLVLDALMDIDE